MKEEEDFYYDENDPAKAIKQREILLMPQYFEKVITPDLADNKDFKEFYNGLPIFTKELKVSNLSKESLLRIQDLNQKILLFWSFGIKDYAKHLLAKRDLLLSSTSSFKMAERSLQHTAKSTSIEKVMDMSEGRGLKDKMFGRS